MWPGMNKKWLLLVIAGALVLSTNTGSKPQVDRIAEAIAHAEGFFVNGSRPQRNNNPGNLTDSFGYQTVGYDGSFPIFVNVAAGWAALKDQIRKMLDGTSRYYSPDMTIAEIANVYTATEKDAWAANVARELGVSINTPLNQV